MSCLDFKNLLLLSLSSAALAGCLVEVAEPLEFRPLQQSGLSCPKCQWNAAQINGYTITDLDLTGEPNEDQVTILYVRDPNGEIHDLGVHEEEFAAFSAGEMVASGAKMIGWQIVLDVAGKTWTLAVTERTELPSWAEKGPTVSVYTLESEDETELCPGSKPGAARLTLLHGETYDGEAKTIAQQGPQWLTLACLDSAVYKMKRLGYGPAGHQGLDGEPASPEQRITTLKMLTADYCGKGQSFTADHTKVLWRNRTGNAVTTDPGQTVDYEAVWTPGGAACIGRPRYASLADVNKVCQLPTCSAYKAANPGPHEWTTLVPWVPPGPKK